MSADYSGMASSASARALKTYDILHNIFEADRRVRFKKKLSRGDVLRCALVSRAFCEPALRLLWSSMSPPDPLWFLLVPPESRPKKLTSEFMDAVLSERTYTDPARWARFLWYARFVRVLCIITSDDLESKHRELVYALMAHNGGASPFPSLLDLQWCPSSYSDSSYFPLFTRQICVAAFIISRPTQEHPYRLDEDAESHIFLTRLQAASPLLCFLAVDASWQRLGDHHIRAICSFDRLVDLDLTARISTSSFRELAAIPHLKYLKAGQVSSDTDSDTVTRALASPAGGLSHPPAARISAPRLQLLSLSGDCPLLTTLFAALCAPNLKTAAFTAVCRDPHPPTVGYVPCLEAVAAFDTLEELQVALHAPAPRARVHLAALLGPLLPLRGLAHFLLMSANRDGRGLRLVASDADFAALARAWPRLRTLRFMDVYWDASRANDGAEEGQEGGEEGEGEPGGDGPGEAGGIAIPRRGPTPTPEVLRLFRDHCPDLWQLMLPYLSLDAPGGVPQLDLMAHDSAPPHGLRRLVLGVKTANTGGDEGEQERARELVEEGKLTDDKAEEWARYVLGLFPNLNEERSIAECLSLSATSGWTEVLQRVRELRSSGRGSESESASLGGMVAELTG